MMPLQNKPLLCWQLIFPARPSLSPVYAVTSARTHHTPLRLNGQLETVTIKKQLLVISGPSGSGKSTFIRQLAERTLASNILDLLPPATANWVSIEANNVLKGDLSAADLHAHIQQTDGCLVHYDIAFIHSHGLARYEDDSALAPLEDANTTLLVIFVKPDFPTLHKQYFARRTRHQKNKSAASRLWARGVRQPIRRAWAALSGQAIPKTHERYDDPQWIETCYRAWEDFLHGLLVRHPQTCVITVTPSAAAEGTPEFRLTNNELATTPPQSPT